VHVMDGDELDIRYGLLCANMVDFFRVFFRESSSLLWDGEAAAMFPSWNNVLPTLSYFLGVLIIDRVCVKPCLRQVFWMWSV
jgi:hypothetical protein